MHRIMHRSHVGDNRVVFADRVAALVRMLVTRGATEQSTLAE